MQKLIRLRNIVLGVVLVITVVLGSLAVLLGILSYALPNMENEYRIQRECTILEPHTNCLNHCSHGIIGEEHCLMYCRAVVRVHPDDDEGFCLDDGGVHKQQQQQQSNGYKTTIIRSTTTLPSCSHPLEKSRNRTTLEFSEHSPFYELKPGENVTCYLDSELDDDSVSFEVLSPVRNMLYVIAITCALIAIMFLFVFIVGLVSVFIHGILPHRLQYKRQEHYEHLEEAYARATSSHSRDFSSSGGGV
ncbi:hypothetical protein FDP41_007379 [Naegleria fowleri]|uniref:Uncharacterized protein n=1 Tax=Naegleria fowleri TaxID=5763 RepID=A0A6A5CB05_NAEFO|nr:uncharacterized protein FDP41_007379 [Naegleria fowleri]KAF0984202.1 hypothetical protein FDP41_007379 [Naegleria fowleri]CAG4712007.1 unnamed protein product [Naegleria fowleri]